MELGVVLFEFGADERVEVVAVEVGFGAFGEVFFVVGESVVADFLAVEEEDFFVGAGFLHGVVGGDDFRVIEGEDLVVVGVGEFVEDDGGVFEELEAGEQGFGVGDVDFFMEAWVVAVVFEPTDAGVVLHGAERRVVVFDPDFAGLEFCQGFSRDEDGDALEVVGEHLEGFGSHFGFGAAFEEGGVDVDRPAFEILFDGIEAGLIGGGEGEGGEE